MADLAADLTLHGWNVDFTWQPSPRGAGRLSEREARHFDDEGFIILRNALEPDLVDEVLDATDRLEDECDALLAAKGGRAGISDSGSITFAEHLVTQSEVLRRFAGHSVLAEVCADLVGPDVNLYWDQAVYKKPERPRRFPWHQDNGYTFVLPQQYLTCWLPLVPATIENGCPHVVPGVHRFGTLQHHYVDPLGLECFSEPPAASVAAPVDPGDVLVFSSLTPHLTGPNTTAEVRKAYILQYAPVGARMLSGDPLDGPPQSETVCDTPDLHFAVVRGGKPASG